MTLIILSSKMSILTFQLMVEHGVFPVELRNKGMVTGYAFMHPIYVKVSLADHPDKAAAVRYAIVMAVIAKLESAS